MKITKTHPITGEKNTLDLDITPDQIAMWNAGQLIQNVMPQLTADEREFLISGLLPGEYDGLFSEEDYDDDIMDDVAF